MQQNNADLQTLRHSASHIMASAVLELFPGTKLGIGPAIEDGFYYDFDLPVKISEADLEKIEKKMQEIIDADYKFICQELSKEEAIKLFKQKNEIYKLALLDDIQEEKVTIYIHNNFVDLCRGPHVESTGKVKYFKLLSISGAYWRGDERNPQLTRIYGTAFFTKQELEEYLYRLEEAKKRDHRKLGRDLELFEIFEDEFGSGLVFWLPKGALVRKIIEDYLRDYHIKKGYKLVYTPHIAKTNLWEISGHLKFYSEYMFSPMDVEGQKYIIKPMNCPGHILIYKSKIRSYRELPLKFFELGTVYRYERSGVLHGLMRVRGFTQDDAHIFTTLDNLQEDIVSLLDTVVEVLTKFGFKEYEIKISTRPQKYIGDLQHWELAENSLKTALEKKNLKYEIDPGEGVFYGPKIDLKIKDAIGRLWQCSTIQVDFNLPERFDIKYRDKDGKDKYVVMIHRALLGSLERFFAVLIENYAGNLPLWLSPIQVIVLPISEKFNEYAEKVNKEFLENNIRSEIDNTDATLQYRIRNAITKKIPFLVILGEKEQRNNTISVRRYSENTTEVYNIKEFIEKLTKLEVNK
ncbi:MAG: threonine--tRNA ligase [Elusimicrobiota bacterium]|nr:threonine--tRNA ligase [Endomicrobiia bacterium]MDW8165917.1 threonine--tRNA ligase [Elusimicrobiota bacterium]